MDNRELARARKKEMRADARNQLMLSWQIFRNQQPWSTAQRRALSYDVYFRQRYWAAALTATWLFNESHLLSIADSFVRRKAFALAEPWYAKAASSFPGPRTFGALGFFYATRTDMPRTGPAAYERIDRARAWFELAARSGDPDMWLEAESQYERLAALASHDRVAYEHATSTTDDTAAAYRQREMEYRAMASAMREARAKHAYSPIPILSYIHDLLGDNDIDTAISFLRSAAATHPSLEENLAEIYATKRRDREQHDKAWERRLASMPDGPGDAVERCAALLRYARSLRSFPEPRRDLAKEEQILQEASEIDLPDPTDELRLLTLRRLSEVQEERAGAAVLAHDDSDTRDALHRHVLETNERIAEVEAEQELVRNLDRIWREACETTASQSSRRRIYFDSAHPVVADSVLAGNAFAIRHLAQLYLVINRPEPAARIFEAGARYGRPELQEHAIRAYRQARMHADAARAQVAADRGIEVPPAWDVQARLWSPEGQQDLLAAFYGLPEARPDMELLDIIPDGHYLKDEIRLQVTDVLAAEGITTADDVASVPLSEIREMCPQMGPRAMIVLGITLERAGLRFNDDLTATRLPERDRDPADRPPRAADPRTGPHMTETRETDEKRTQIPVQNQAAGPDLPAREPAGDDAEPRNDRKEPPATAPDAIIVAPFGPPGVFPRWQSVSGGQTRDQGTPGSPRTTRTPPTPPSLGRSRRHPRSGASTDEDPAGRSGASRMFRRRSGRTGTPPPAEPRPTTAPVRNDTNDLDASAIAAPQSSPPSHRAPPTAPPDARPPETGRFPGVPGRLQAPGEGLVL